MINVSKLGTLGNNLWQYSVSRIIAEKYKLKLNCYSIPGFPRTFEIVNGNEYSNPVFEIQGHYFDLNSLPFNSKIEMNGYVQRYEYIQPFKNKVKKWFQIDTKSPIQLNSDDFVISIRRGWNGYPVSLCPSQEFFLSIFKNINYKRIILCTDSFDDPFFEFLNSLDVEIIKAQYSPLEQFAVIQSANKILLTPSTYCWWASFLSKAQEIYYPLVSDFIPTERNQNLLVYDENRYIVLE